MKVRSFIVCLCLLGIQGSRSSSPEWVKGFNSKAVRDIISREHKPEQNNVGEEQCQTATFAAGCFWSVELAFQRVPGVVSTKVGYTDGDKKSPEYKEVCTGKTGHTEAVQVLFNPEVVTFNELLMVLFDIRDPTKQYVPREGDYDTNYRSGIYYHSDEQKADALNFIQEMQCHYETPIVLEVKPASEFWPAEEYHQQYLEKGGQKADKGYLEPIKCYG